MTQTTDELFDAGIERYKAGEGPDTLIPVFKDICDRAPKNSSAWTCLAWLYLLGEKPEAAFKSAQKAVKLMPKDPQARINLALAILETGRKGVREHIEEAAHVISLVEELEKEIKDNFKDALSRRPDWPNLLRVQKWLFEG
jgi:predicted Zn-dependent protease